MRRKALIWILFGSLIWGPASTGLAQKSALTIEDCIQLALKNNPQLRNAEHQMNLAATSVTSARANILPSLSSSVNTSRRFQAEQGPYLQEVPIRDPQTGQVRLVQKEIYLDSYYRNTFSSGLNLMQNIFDGGRWWNQIKQANAKYQSAEHSYRAAREQTIALVAQRYYELLKAMELQKVYEQSVESAREQLKRTQSMFEVGSVAQVDVYRARVTLGQEQTNLIQQRNAVRLAENNLKLAMGINPGRKITVLPGELKLEPLNLSLDELYNLAVRRNPELKGLEETLRADRYGIKLAKASFWPNISFRASYSRFNTVWGRLYQPFDKNYQLSGSISLSWNLFNGFADAANVERQSIGYYMDKENLINRKLSLRSEIEQAYLSLQAYDEIERINRDNLKAAEEDLRLSEERYKVGSGTLLDVIDARVGLTRARATLVSTKYDKLIALAQLYSKLGMLEEKICETLQK